MEMMKVIDWTEMNKQRGSLIVVDDGICFQRYDMGEGYQDVLGDAVSVRQTGVFGAFNLYHKLSKSNEEEIVRKAKELREEKGLNCLIKDKKIVHVPWSQMKGIKKSSFFDEILVQTKLCGEIKIYRLKEHKEFADYILKRIEDQKKNGV